MSRSALQPTYISADDVYLSFTTADVPEALRWNDITGLVDARFSGLLLEVASAEPVAVDMAGYARDGRQRLVEVIVDRAGLAPVKPEVDIAGRDAAFAILYDRRVPSPQQTASGRRAYVRAQRRLLHFARSFARPGMIFQPDRVLLEGMKLDQARAEQFRLDAESPEDCSTDDTEQDPIPSSENTEKG